MVVLRWWWWWWWCGGTGRLGDAQDGGRAAELVEHQAMEGFEPAALGPRQVLGEAKARQLRERVAEAVERALQGRGSW